MIRKIARCVLACLLGSVVLTGCSGQETEITDKTIERADEVLYNDVFLNVGFIQTGKESDWRDANTTDYFNRFTLENGYNLIYVDGNSEPSRQMKAFHDFVAQGVDYIILDPIVEDGWEESLLAAKEKEIPVLVVDRKVNCDSSLYDCWIGSDFTEEGRRAIRWLEDYLAQNGRENEALDFVILEGTEGASATIGRTKGILSEMEKHPNWHVVRMEAADFTQGGGKTVMERILREYPKFDVLISENDNMMFGAMNAMDQAGIMYGVDGDVITISFDALQEAFERMMERKLCVSVECNPLIARSVRQVIEDKEQGKMIRHECYVEEEVFSYENAARYIGSRRY